MQLSLQKLPGKWIGISGLIMFALGSGVGFYGFPALIRSQIASNLALKKGSDLRKLWSKIPDGIDFKIYMFNITNPMDVQVGKKPIVTEIGPYFYEEYKEKLDLKDHNEDDTVSFNPRDYFIFKREKSGGLTGDEIITIPHMAILAMALAVEREKPAALKLINKAIPHIFGHPTSVFLTAPVKNILFEGVPLYCNVTDFSAKAICSEIRKNDKGFLKLGEDIFGFSFFGTKNNSAGGRFRVKRGIQNIKEVGQVVEYEGEKQLSVYDGEECNKFRGTDSTIFAPFLTPSDKIEAFAPDLCRSIGAEYKESIVYKGIHSYSYGADFGDMSSDPQLKCFCTTPTTCMKKGIHDLTRCSGAPIMASLPHFYDAALEYQTGVIGLNPSKEKHEILMIFEPLTSTPLVGYKRLQFNIDVHPIDKIDLMKEIPTVLLPILWVQEGMELKQEYLDKVNGIFKIIGAVDVIKWILMVAGGGLGAAGALATYRKKSNEMDVEVSPSVPKKPSGISPLEVQTPHRY